MLRTRFKKEIVAEFLPSSKWLAPKEWGEPYKLKPSQDHNERIVILCDGMPSLPHKQALAEFLSKKGYFVIYPRYRGSWESEGVFLQKSPHLDVLDIIDGLEKGIVDVTFGQKFKIHPKEIFVIGGSFGGPAAILASMDSRIKKVVACCAVVDWTLIDDQVETSDPSYVAYIKEAFGRAYNLPQKNWDRLKAGKLYNPAAHAQEIDPQKIIMFHAKDDPVVPWDSVNRFAKATGVKLYSQKRGGHISTAKTVIKNWNRIKKFFHS